MDTPPTMSEATADKARLILDQRRVRLILPTRESPPGAVVLGETADYEIWFTDDGTSCDCYAGSDHAPLPEPRCSHAVAAMVLWADVLAAVPAARETL